VVTVTGERSKARLNSSTRKKTPSTSDQALSMLLEERLQEDEALREKNNLDTIKTYSKDVNRKSKKKSVAKKKTPVKKKSPPVKNKSPVTKPTWVDIDNEEDWLRKKNLEANKTTHLQYLKAKIVNRKHMQTEMFPKKTPPKKKAVRKKLVIRSKEKRKSNRRKKPDACPRILVEVEDHQAYEIEPIYENERNIIGEDDKRIKVQASTQDEILNHRKLPNEEPELLVKFNNGEQCWTTVDFAYGDGVEDVEGYFDLNNLNDTRMVTTTMINARKIKEDEKRKREQERIVQDKAMGRKCRHDDWQIEMGYEREGMSKYCIAPSDLAGVECCVCGSAFVGRGRTVEGHTFRPTFPKPAYVCINRLRNCKHAACYTCFHEKNRENSSGNSTARRTRSNI
jgi:hypothetical protein